jgi:hypothetical protein
MTDKWYEEKEKDTTISGPLQEPTLREKLICFYRIHDPKVLADVDTMVKFIQIGGKGDVHRLMMKNYGTSIWPEKIKKDEKAPRHQDEDLRYVFFGMFLIFVIVVGSALFLLRMVAYLNYMGDKFNALCACLLDINCSLM